MVSLNARQSASEIGDVLEERDVQGLGVIALAAAGGVVVAQEVADRILPMLSYSPNPNNATGFVASAAVKAAIALGFGIAASGMTGYGLVALAYMAVGALAGAGADVLNAVQRSGFAAEAPSGSVSRSSSSSSASTSAGGQTYTVTS